MRHACFVIASILLFFPSGRTEQVVSEASEIALRQAILKGGRIRCAFDGTIRLTNQITVSTDMQLDAIGQRVVLDGRGSNRVFDIQGARVAISNIVFANTAHVGAEAQDEKNNRPFTAEPGTGGAIRVTRGALNLSDCTFSNTLSMGGAAGAFGHSWEPSFFVVHGGASYGGAIYAEESFLSIANCSFLSNRVVGSEALIYPTAGRPFTTSPGPAWGGAIFATNSFITVANSVFSSANATAFSGMGTGGTMFGGAIAAEKCFTEIRDCAFRNNKAGGTTNSTGTLALGGAGYFLGGEVLIRSSLFLSNSARAGAFNDAEGGAIWTKNSATAEASSFIGNSVEAGTGGIFGIGGVPGGVSRGGAIVAFGELVLSNSTVAFNLAKAPPLGFGGGGQAYGGAIFCTNDGLIAFSTIVTNFVQPWSSGESLGPAAAGGIYSSNKPLTIAGTILSGNSHTNIVGPIFDFGANLNSDTKRLFQHHESANAIDPKLGTLKSLPGGLYFFPLLPGSPAIDRGRSFTGFRGDQLGFPRDVPRPDSGAIEWQGEQTKAEIIKQEGTLFLKWQDPSYQTGVIERSIDLEHWHSLPFSYEQALAEGGSWEFFRFRAASASDSPDQ